MKKILLIVVGITVYLNIGWVIGTFYLNVVNIPCEKSSSVWICKAAVGPWRSSDSDHSLQKSTRVIDIIDFFVATVIWPVLIMISIVLWISYGFVQLLWLIFAGGVVKLLGLV